MRTLIYYVCFGEQFKKLLNMSLYSLFNVGKYDGTVVIITDFKKEDFYPSERIKIINVPDIKKETFFIRNMKSSLINYMDIRDYDFILYLDADVLINSDRLVPLMNEWGNQKHLWIQHDIVPIKKNKPYCGSEVLTPEEKKNFGNYGFNAGIIGAKTALYSEVCSRWHILNYQHNFSKCDQGNLVAVIVRNYLDVVKYTNDTAITNRKNDEHRTETILHFLTKSEAAMYSYFDKYIKEKK